MPNYKWNDRLTIIHQVGARWVDNNNNLVENQKGAISLSLYKVSGISALLVLNGTLLNSINALLVLNGTLLNSINALLVLNGTLLNSINALLVLNGTLLNSINALLVLMEHC